MKRDLFKVIVANGIVLIASVINGFLFPRFLSMEEYAQLRTFTFYVSYIGVLHFGYVDGVYLSYGGKDKEVIETLDFYYTRRVLTFFQTIITIIVITIGLLLRNSVLIIAGTAILPINMLSLYRFSYQATGEFDAYKKLLNLTSLITIVFNLFFLLVVRISESKAYMIIQIVISYAMWIYTSKRTKGISVRVGIDFQRFYKLLIMNIKSGILVMLGNGMSIFITSMDRWFIMALCSSKEFAQYSFAASLIRMMTVVTSSLSVVFYSFICKDYSYKNLLTLRERALVIGALMMIVAQPVYRVVEVFLPEYMGSIRTITLLFAAQFFIVVVTAIYQNIFKALGQKKQFLFTMIITLTVGMVINIIMGRISGNQIEGYAFATLITTFFWVIICQFYAKEYKVISKEWGYIIVIMMLFFFCARIHTLWIIPIYIICNLTLSFILFGNRVTTTNKR